MPILETIAAANAAYSVIRKCLENGREVKDMVGQVGKFLTAEEELQEAVKKKKNSPITAITGGQEGDWEEFQALERIREQRRELESWCRLYAPARKRRQEAKKAAQKAYEKRMEQIQITSGILLAVTVCVLGIYYLGVYLERW
jgi:cytochrome c-type biogenesis protein CcmH/NrfG